MNKIVEDVIKFYENSALEEFINSEKFKTLKSKVDAAGYTLDYRICVASEANRRVVDKKIIYLSYLCFEVLDKQNNVIEIFDEGCLTWASYLVRVINKKKFKNLQEYIEFLDWKEDEDMIGQLDFCISQINID